MSIFNSIFGQQQAPAAPAPAPVADPSQQQAAPAPTQQGNIPAAPTTTVDPANPAAPVVDPAAPADPNAPLAQFQSLWENTPNTDGSDPQPAAPMTPEQVAKAVQGADFSSAINPEHMQAVLAGGEDAANAMAQVLNQVGRQIMVQQTLVNNKLTEKAVAEAVDAQQAKIPELVRTHATQAHMQTENPVFNNPAIKPVVEATRSQLQTKFPNATPAEVSKMTQDFIMGMGEAFAPKPDPTALPAGEQDWSKFI